MALTAILCGDDSLTVECGRLWRGAGHAIAAVVTASPRVAAWAAAGGLRAEAPGPDLAARLAGTGCDWILSVAWLRLVAPEVLALARHGAVNFHDGPLPDRAGLNAPVWALLAGEAEHAITWHLMTPGVDEGAVALERRFPIGPEDTALSLNARCFAAALDSFPELVAGMERGLPGRTPQPARLRREHRRADRPAGGARLDFARPAAEVARLVRALDHGDYANPLATARVVAGGRVLSVGAALPEAGHGAPGQVLEATPAGLVVACGQGAVRLMRLRAADGTAVCPGTIRDAALAVPEAAEAAAWGAALAAAAPFEGRARAALRGFRPLDPGAGAGAPEDWRALPLGTATARDAALALVRALGGEGGIAYATRPAAVPGLVTGWWPLAFATDGTLSAARAACAGALEAADRAGASFACDLGLREPALGGLSTPPAGLSLHGPIPGSALTVAVAGGGATLHHDAARLPAAAADRIAARLRHILAALPGSDPAAPFAALPALPPDEAEVLRRFNATARDHDRGLTLPAAFAAAAARHPDRVAVTCEAARLSYADLDARANRIAHVLRGLGVGPGVFVGLAVPRSTDLVAGALGILKAGGAYVPMDPAYPADRLALYAQDSGCPVILAHSGVALPEGPARLDLDTDARLAAAPAAPPEGGAGPTDAAYLIYTSGSTGRPKGVVVEHRNLANFFAGMDDRIGTDPGTWLAVTSLSFDISVLELFWTLARGFSVVIASDANRNLPAGGPLRSGGKMEFSLYYWGNDGGAGPQKYGLLLDGARFADAHGFSAVWTPERHFHAFGGPYPNPAVTGAAVAAVTRNIGVRAGSCVAPLHHPARIAEEWAVIDNLTGGRAGLAIASGWHPDDFVLRPENAPPGNKAAMLAGIDTLRRLWRGEAVEFDTGRGSRVAVVTQPRPVSAEVPIWVTTAGNPETWIEAGRLGANVLTHLLGQSLAEVGDKIALYRRARAEAGHDPAGGAVTLMLHTYLARDRAAAREVARGPMKDYLRSAANLIKAYAWAFPAFRKPAGAASPMDIDLSTLSPEESEAILDFAFARYFEDSGLFGTVEDALARVDQVRALGVTEIACLIDYGIAPERVMEGLWPLAEVVRRANLGLEPAEDDFSLAAEIRRHRVTHLQCTPSMARMLAGVAEARAALAGLRTLMVGGEALPATLAADLRAAAPGARLLNMYGPTETTIWSTLDEVTAVEGAVAAIGRPIANTQCHVLDAGGRPCPLGVPGELWIGGEGVARGYWNRPDLTADRFRPDPFAGEGARIYGTGDLAVWQADGRLGFLGRADAQVKLRGHRIEPGEIEAALEGLPGVAQAVVVLREDRAGDARLVAYVTGEAPDQAPDETTARAALAARLPGHMVPAHVVRLPALPLTPNGKIDRKALPAPSAAPSVEAPPAPAAAPAAVGGLDAAEVQRTVAGVWQRLLGVAQVAPGDNFFALGGHSLLAVQAHRDLRAALPGAALSITDIFRFPVFSALVGHLAGGASPVAPARPAPVAAPAAPVAVPAAPVLAATPEARADARSEAMDRRRALRAARAGP